MNRSFTQVAAYLAMTGAPAVIIAQQPKSEPKAPQAQYSMVLSTGFSCLYKQTNSEVPLKAATVMINDLTIPQGLPFGGMTFHKGFAIFEYGKEVRPVILNADGQLVVQIVPGGNSPPPPQLVTQTMQKDAIALRNDCARVVKDHPGVNVWAPDPPK